MRKSCGTIVSDLPMTHDSCSPFTSVTGCVPLDIKPRPLLGTVEGEQLQSWITVSALNQSRLPWLAIWQWQHTPLMSQTNALVMLLGGVETSPPPALSHSLHPIIKIAQPINLICITRTLKSNVFRGWLRCNTFHSHTATRTQRKYSYNKFTGLTHMSIFCPAIFIFSHYWNKNIWINLHQRMKML